ncbi:MAG TPA: carbamoyltransferase C-terminal domain-containing protein [Pyrinomonadaceae bacterium]|nr:carbamoyltransferase C-terminal domain-containing protein [Pyrinomonadaceae bacterium]
MFVLGVHGGRKREDEDNHLGFALHDSAAVLLLDGQVVAAIEEERLNRIKHTNCFPVQAIKYCLEENRLSLTDVDYIAINTADHMMNALAKRAFLVDNNLKAPIDGRTYVASLFESNFGVNVEARIRFCRHHVAHAWSAFAPSGYDNSLVLVLDGDGDNLSGMVLLAESNKMTTLAEYGVEQSLGHFYAQIISLLGYQRFDEYKAMGLAPYGNPKTYSSLFHEFYRLLPGGNFEIADASTSTRRLVDAGIVDQARRRSEPFAQIHKDIAAALQETLEDIVLHILQHYAHETKQKKLCFAGGVAHNCTLNGRILYSDLFDKVFVQPAAHDAGGAMGSALSVFQDEDARQQPHKLEHLYFGTDIDRLPETTEKTLGRWSDFLTFEKVDLVTQRTAQLLADGFVVGWVQGRSEFGPRALGNRSILADPRPAFNKLLINEMVKKREAYRPFAPSVLEESLHEFFDVPSNRAEFPFMIFVLKVREQMRELLGAVTHVDGTARVQTVSRKWNRKYWELIHEFQKLTGVPILLNTSFNNNAEPIVDSVEDAIVCYLTTGLDYLVVGDYIAQKKDTADPALEALVPSLPKSRKLVKRTILSEPGKWESVFEIEGTMSHYFARRRIIISPEVFAMFMAAGSNRSLATLFDEIEMTNSDRRAQLLEEIKNLWIKRIIILQPGIV